MKKLITILFLLLSINAFAQDRKMWYKLKCFATNPPMYEYYFKDQNGNDSISGSIGAKDISWLGSPLPERSPCLWLDKKGIIKDTLFVYPEVGIFDLGDDVTNDSVAIEEVIKMSYLKSVQLKTIYKPK